ncbi:DUF3427 domain-containing protein [Candidatus Uabimicrobium amorphum]|uniref:Helicase n=1 Tax=Uabimicrobium amorphum TaxID=2596890 RepID=A0A5S9IRN9_UABAM|nr:DUF3427 domain-containing protein [Candidatus Uabimicrobium amorphum]BBM86849.1 helicase [Candidatus Uabimicrobium amorphum]
MSEFNQELQKSLLTGFVNRNLNSKFCYQPELLINDKRKNQTVLSVLLRELEQCRSFRFSVAFATMSGVASLMKMFDDLRCAKVSGQVLVSQYQNYTQPQALRSLLQFKNIQLRIVSDGCFHAKGYIFQYDEYYNLIVGSSNLTAPALQKNNEWNLKVSSAYEGKLVVDTLQKFEDDFAQATVVDDAFIDRYTQIYSRKSFHFDADFDFTKPPKPNKMQLEALENLDDLRREGKNKALLISATGTGKTYLSAFDTKKLNPDRLLFVVHRANIARAALHTFQKVFGESKKMGMYSGQELDSSADFVFSTIQTISQDHHLVNFSPDSFDYIVIDETHRAGAKSYQKIMSHFTPNFLLGLTATPERTDGHNIFKEFDYNIAYEIRLHDALEQEMLCDFHYYGIRDVSVDGQVLGEETPFNLLTANERIHHIIDKVKMYGTDNGKTKGLVFCRSVEESNALSLAFNERGFNTISLTGASSEEKRAKAIELLESDVGLDYIFTRDIFNEGIDIPKVNQVIMLRPTQSAIIFVQQLGRGLRKAHGKEYLTVLDFIGNYNNNFLIPVALFGDSSYNKDTLRKMMASGSCLMPGTSTVNFERIVQQQIFAAIDRTNLSLKKDLRADYKLLKFKIGKVPMMMDFVRLGSRDPYLYVKNSKSYFNFVAGEESEYATKLSPQQRTLLQLFSLEIANGKRIEEVLILLELLTKQEVSFAQIKTHIQERYGISSMATIESCVRNLNFVFVKQPQQIVHCQQDVIQQHESFTSHLCDQTFYKFLHDNLEYAKDTYERLFDKDSYVSGFLLYRKYSRKDVCRILNWQDNESSTMYGYKVKYNTCPIFVNYHKEDNISESTKYHDYFINRYEFNWMSRSKRTLESKEIIAIRNHQKNELRLPLFIKKSNDEGTDFYYMGDVTATDSEQSTIKDDHGKDVSVVQFKFKMNTPVAPHMYDYITAR